MYILFIYFQLVLWKDTHSFFSFLFQLLLIVQPLEHVALFSHCHASQCVLVNFWKAHTRASSLTRLVATFLTTNTKITSTLLEKEETFINLYMNTLNREHWCADSGNLTEGRSYDHVFVRHFGKIALHVGSKTCLDQIKLYGSIARVSRVRICIVG